MPWQPEAAVATSFLGDDLLRVTTPLLFTECHAGTNERFFHHQVSKMRIARIYGLLDVKV